MNLELEKRIRSEYYYKDGDLYSIKRKKPFRSKHSAGYYNVGVTLKKKLYVHRIIWFSGKLTSPCTAHSIAALSATEG